VDGGYVMPQYLQGMLDRDHSLSVFMGNTLAIPHGEFEYKQYIKKSGIVIKVYPEPLDWHGEKVHLVLGLAGIGEDHINILANCATVFSEMSDVERIVKNQSVDEIYDLLTAEED
jgi:mannitol/fructose-specific phosphotransferase system IIA component